MGPMVRQYGCAVLLAFILVVLLFLVVVRPPFAYKFPTPTPPRPTATPKPTPEPTPGALLHLGPLAGASFHVTQGAPHWIAEYGI